MAGLAFRGLFGPPTTSSSLGDDDDDGRNTLLSVIDDRDESMQVVMEEEEEMGGGDTDAEMPDASEPVSPRHDSDGSSSDSDSDSSGDESDVHMVSAHVGREDESIPDLEDVSSSSSSSSTTTTTTYRMRMAEGRLRGAGLTRRRMIPFRGVPTDHPIHEAMCLVVPQCDLTVGSTSDAIAAASHRSAWGDFGTAPAAQATKRLLFLWMRAVEMAVKTPSGSVEDYVLPESPAARPSRSRGRRDQQQTQQQTQPPVVCVQRPAGVGGAVDGDFIDTQRVVPVGPLSQFLTTPPSSLERVRCHPGEIGGLFVLETLPHPDDDADDDDDDDDGGGATTRVSVGRVLRRVSIVLEELMEETDGKTAGWRWWVLVHDARIVLPQWVNLAISESARLYEIRTEQLERGARSGRRRPAFESRPFGGARTPQCYQTIRSMRDFVRDVAAYWRSRSSSSSSSSSSSRSRIHGSGRQERRGRRRPHRQQPPCPTVDMASAAASAGAALLAPTAAAHPSRVFSPSVAMTLHCDRVCDVQCKLDNYTRAHGEGENVPMRLGAFPRAHWTTYYGAVDLPIAKLHRMMLPQDPDRQRVLQDLRVEATSNGLMSSMPQEVSVAFAEGRMEDAFAGMDQYILNQEYPQTEGAAARSREAVMGQLRTELADAVSERDIHARQAQENADAVCERMAERDAAILRQHAASCSGGRVAGSDDDDDDDGDAHEAIPGLGGFSAEEWARNLSGRVPDSAITDRLLSSLLATEDTASLNMEMVKRNVHLQLRLVNSRQYRIIDSEFKRIDLVGSPAHRLAIDTYRRSALKTWWETIMQHLELDKTKPVSERKMSDTMSKGVEFLLSLRPNLIRRHRDAIHKARRQAAANDDDDGGAADRVDDDRRATFLRAYAGLVQQRSLSSALHHGSAPRRRQWQQVQRPQLQGQQQQQQQQQQQEALEDDDDTMNLWSEWPPGALNQSPWATCRTTMFSCLVQHFRCRPGAHLTAYRLLLAVGTCVQYLWKLRPHQALLGQGGVGKSFILDLVMKLLFPGMFVRMDNVTEKGLAIGHDSSDKVRVFEEIPNALVGRDRFGGDRPADPLHKAAMTENRIDTTSITVNKETGERLETLYMSRQMNLYVGSSNFTDLDPRKPIMQRWQIGHVAPDEGEKSTPISAISNAMESERNDPWAASFCQEMKVIHVLIMLIEKMIMARVTPIDVNTDICTLHFPWFFEAVRTRCRVPEVKQRQQAMLRLLVRQATIRKGIYMTFSSVLASRLRCQRKADAPPDADGPEVWEGAPFRPEMLLEVLPHLWADEEVMTDVLTSTADTYTPVTTWNLVEVMAKLFREGGLQDRKIYGRPVVAPASTAAAAAAAEAAGPHVNENISSSAAAASSSNNTIGGGGGGGMVDVIVADMSGEPQQQQQHADDVAVARIRQAAGLAIGGGGGGGNGLGPQVRRTDANYCVIEFQNRTLAYERFSQESEGRLEPGIVSTVLKGLQRVRVPHFDQNNPMRHRTTGGLQTIPSPDGEGGPTLYRSRTKLKSNVVIIESVPSASAASFGGGGFGGRFGRGGGGGDRRRPQQPTVQICFLKEYLMDRSHVSVVDILHEGLQYAAATRRWVITGGVKQVSHLVSEYGHSSARRVVREFLDAREIIPDPLKVHTRVNYFARNDVTQAFVYNRCLSSEPGRDRRRTFGNSRTDPDRQVQQWMAGDFDTQVARRYWSQAGFEYDAERMPEAMRQRIAAMMESPEHCDDLGVELSEVHHDVYPDDFITSERDRGPMVIAPGATAAAAAAAGQESDDPSIPALTRGVQTLRRLQAHMMSTAARGIAVTLDADGEEDDDDDDDSSRSSSSSSSRSIVGHGVDEHTLDEASVQEAMSEHPELMFGGWYLRDVNDAARRDRQTRRRHRRREGQATTVSGGGSGRPRKRARFSIPPVPSSSSSSPPPPPPSPSDLGGPATTTAADPNASMRTWIRRKLAEDPQYQFDVEVWPDPESERTFKRIVQEVRNEVQRATALAAVRRRQRQRMIVVPLPAADGRGTQ